MKVLAAVNIRQFDRTVASVATYNTVVEKGLHIVLQDTAIKPAEQNEKHAAGFIVFGSDQGMCGPFNEQIAGFTRAETHKEKDVHIIAVGGRVAPLLEDRGLGVDSRYPVPGSPRGVNALVQQLIIDIEAWAAGQHIGKVSLLNNRSKGGVSYEPRRTGLLPVSVDWLNELKARKWETRIIPTYTMEYSRLFSRLIRQHLYVNLYRACAESLSAENTGRLAAMQAAEKNIDDRLSGLHREFNHERQSAITSELLDIIAGYEALAPSSGGGL
jgi:F-type H+-transporting ATPase subunit gamma